MRLGLDEGWAGRRRKVAVCPNCSSERARYSRRHYDGPWFLLFRVRPVKCSDCGSYFAIAEGATIRQPETDPIGLHIPFRPSELDEPAEEYMEEPETGRPASPQGSKPSRRACPTCGSHAVRLSSPGADQPLTRRLEIRATYRCARCNGSFRRIDPMRLLILSVIVFTVLGGLSYIATAKLSGRGPGDTSPRIEKDRIKQPPPPVFR